MIEGTTGPYTRNAFTPVAEGIREAEKERYTASKKRIFRNTLIGIGLGIIVAGVGQFGFPPVAKPSEIVYDGSQNEEYLLGKDRTARTLLGLGGLVLASASFILGGRAMIRTKKDYGENY